MSKSVHVEPVADGWAVKQGSEQTRAYPTKEEALRAGRELAREQHAEHIVHRRDGRIEERDSYGSDPFPPRRSK